MLDSGKAKLIYQLIHSKDLLLAAVIPAEASQEVDHRFG